jgi:diadenosine tetraphosphate (Ap4A) HIT family hydrolase
MYSNCVFCNNNNNNGKWNIISTHKSWILVDSPLSNSPGVQKFMFVLRGRHASTYHDLTTDETDDLVYFVKNIKLPRGIIDTIIGFHRSPSIPHVHCHYISVNDRNRVTAKDLAIYANKNSFYLLENISKICKYGNDCYRTSPEHIKKYHSSPSHNRSTSVHNHSTSVHDHSTSTHNYNTALQYLQPGASVKCIYGKDCYRTNPDHIKEYHTAPSQYCVYGKNCYRRNPDHIRACHS